jgi:[ribosomal protein S5]-alanine N-acetyltransferase
MTAPRLETARLLLRPLLRDDAPVICQLAGDRQIAATTLNIPHPYPPEAAVAFIEHTMQPSDQNFTFGIERRSDTVFMGVIGLHAQHGFRAEIGYWMGVPYWGQGYMTEAVRRVIQFGFDDLHLERIHAWCFAHNPASARVMAKAGMQFEGIMRQHYLKWGEFVDAGCYSIIRPDYEAETP